MALVDVSISVDPSNVVVSSGAAQGISVSQVPNNINVAGAPGIRGPKGEDGQAVNIQTFEAGANLSGHRAIRVSAGLAYVCDGATAAHAGRCIGVSTGAAAQGDATLIQTIGVLTEPSWSWIEGPVFVGADGILTQSLAGLAFIQQVGVAVSSTTVDINPQLPILIS